MEELLKGTYFQVKLSTFTGTGVAGEGLGNNSGQGYLVVLFTR